MFKIPGTRATLPVWLQVNHVMADVADKAERERNTQLATFAVGAALAALTAHKERE